MNNTTPRGPGGRFGAGNKFGKGNPKLMLSAIMRDALKTEVTPEKAKKMAQRLISIVDSDDDSTAIKAFESIADRIGGKPSDAITVEEVESLQAQVEELTRVVAALTNGRSVDAN